MTREEREAAIAFIKGYRKLDEDLHNTAPKDSVSYYATDRCLKYWDIAIQALSQESCDDVISREWLMRKATERFYTTNYFNHISAMIEEAPSVTQKSKTGHWIYDETIENWRCSKCNETPKTMGYCGTADFMAEHFKFCNHCGAKMVEPQESEE